MMNKETELRKLPADYLSYVEEVLETNEDWKRFMRLIPKNLENIANEHYEPKYTGEDIKLIEDYATKKKLNCAEVLFREWGTSGRVRPTLKTIQTLLVKAHMFKAADTIAKMLGEPLPQRPNFGPAEPVDTSITKLLNTDSQQQLKSTGSDHCNNTTKQIGQQSAETDIKSCINPGAQHSNEQVSASSMIKFSKTVDSEHLSAEERSVSHLIKFSKNVLSDSEYLPASAILNPKTNHFETGPSLASTSYSESLESHSHGTQSTPSRSFQSSKFYEQTDIDILEDANLIQFAYQELEAITNSFSGTLIGSGGFGDVFLGSHEALGLLAVKKVKPGVLSLDMETKMFNTEVKSLSLLRHENIVPILGFSLDEPARCIVCEYIDGGSLKEKLAEKALNKTQRMNIMIGTAEGLRYIHSTEKPSPNTEPSSKKAYFLHNDVKSANILLTKDCIPKLCDFGLVRHCDTTQVTVNIIGTGVYMAPERILYGTYTQKSDVYSYGIVLLEIITGLQPIIFENNMNIKGYLTENCVDDNITPFIDIVVGEWIEAQSIYSLARHCLKVEKSKRPSMDEICKDLNKIQNNKN